MADEGPFRGRAARSLEVKRRLARGPTASPFPGPLEDDVGGNTGATSFDGLGPEEFGEAIGPSRELGSLLL